jgi:hypothetical protein
MKNTILTQVNASNDVEIPKIKNETKQTLLQFKQENSEEKENAAAWNKIANNKLKELNKIDKNSQAYKEQRVELQKKNYERMRDKSQYAL